MALNRDDYVSLLKEAFVTLGVDSVMKRLVAQIPFLAWPFFNPLTKLAIRWVVKELVERGETAAFFYYIDVRIKGQHLDFEKAAIENSIAQLEGSPEEKKRAEENLKVAFRNFVHLTT